jgi:hypothetical protein
MKNSRKETREKKHKHDLRYVAPAQDLHGKRSWRDLPEYSPIHLTGARGRLRGLGANDLIQNTLYR